MNKRIFKLINIIDDNGVYKGRYPSQAALKVFNNYCKKIGVEECSKKFSIKEVTKNSKKKTYHYTGTRTKTENPIAIFKNKDGEPTYYVNYEIKVKKL